MSIAQTLEIVRRIEGGFGAEIDSLRIRQDGDTARVFISLRVRVEAPKPEPKPAPKEPPAEAPKPEPKPAPKEPPANGKVERKKASLDPESVRQHLLSLPPVPEIDEARARLEDLLAVIPQEKRDQALRSVKAGVAYPLPEKGDFLTAYLLLRRQLARYAGLEE